MGALNQKYIWNNVYLSLYTWQQQYSNGYTYVLEIKQHDCTCANTVCEYCPMSGWISLVYLQAACNRKWMLIYHKPRCGRVFELVQLWCLTPKHRYSRWNFVAILHTSWATRYFIYTSGYSCHLGDKRQCLYQSSRVDNTLTGECRGRSAKPITNDQNSTMYSAAGGT